MVVVTFKHESFHFQVNVETIRLETLKGMIYKETKIPIERQKLFFAGGWMKEDKQLLSQYGIDSTSKLLLMGSIPAIPPHLLELQNKVNQLCQAMQQLASGDDKQYQQLTEQATQLFLSLDALSSDYQIQRKMMIDQLHESQNNLDNLYENNGRL